MALDIYWLSLLVAGGLLLFSLVGGELTEALEAVAMRATTFAVAGFGAAGVLLRLISPESNPFAVALLVAAALFLVVKAMFKVAAGSELDANFSGQIVGRVAEVTVPIREGGAGMVRLELNGQMQSLRATSTENIPAGASVLITAHDPERGHLEVSPWQEGP